MSTYKINIYKIWWEDKDDFYVGSTKQRLSVRMAGHRGIGKKNKNKQKLYRTMNKEGYGYNFNYVLLDSKQVANVDEKLKLEQEYIDKLRPNLNSGRACYDPTMWDDKERKKLPRPFTKIDIRAKLFPKGDIVSIPEKKSEDMPKISVNVS